MKNISKETIIIGWLYPDLMSTYGDRGNLFCLKKRCEWRGISVQIMPIEVDTSSERIKTCDLFIGGGAQDRQQEIVIHDLLKRKSLFQNIFERGIPGLFVCGSPQLLGHYYTTGEGKKLPGLEIFDFVTRHFGNDKPRCIGNTVGKVIAIHSITNTIVGFENHGGRTYLGKDTKPFAKVIRGYGNNGEDGYEGAVYRNVIACYYHGPLLPKNPHVADWLLAKALEVKYKKKPKLKPLDDELEWQAHAFMLKRMKIK